MKLASSSSGHNNFLPSAGLKGSVKIKTSEASQFRQCSLQNAHFNDTVMSRPLVCHFIVRLNQRQKEIKMSSLGAGASLSKGLPGGGSRGVVHRSRAYAQKLSFPGSGWLFL